MGEIIELETERLRLRQWREPDRAAFKQLNSDPEVMRYFPALLSSSESDALLDRIRNLIDTNGWGFWAAETRDTAELIGFVGLHQPTYDLPFNPCTEVGWRLAKAFWGRGYATEAARAALSFGFDNLNLFEIVSFTAVSNRRSRAVMERLQMINSNENFVHPAIPKGHDLEEHVLYRLSRDRWLESRS